MILETIIRFGILVFWSLIIWGLGFMFHEICHGIESFRQTGNFGTIGFRYFELKLFGKKLRIPSMYHVSGGTLRNKKMYYLAGGIYSGLVMLGLSFPFHYIYLPIGMVLFTVGMVNLIYGRYEGEFILKLSYKKYMKYHYVIYIIVIGLCILFFIKEIYGWLI